MNVYTNAMRLHSLLGLLAACLLATATAKADVIIGNGPDSTVGGGTSIFAGVLKGVGFTMTSTIYVGSARLSLSTGNSNVSPTVYLMSDAGNKPGSVLTTFQGPVLSSDPTPLAYLFTLPTAYQLVNGTTYWLVAAGSSNQALFLWRGDDTPTGAHATYLGARLSGDSGASYAASAVANSFELLSAAAPPPPPPPPPAGVPEPSVAITLSAMGLIVFTRSRRRRALHS
ncbi:hypothetical protein F183_A05970 [Bryobacterales bacterium F-183]|nr:hypothetical protein F183_A05970 [Bryobacterales bacterium F-183]